MRISSVNSVNSNARLCKFGAQNSAIQTGVAVLDEDKRQENIRKLAVFSTAVAALALGSIFAMSESNRLCVKTSLQKIGKKASDNFHKYFPAKDPVIKLLDGKRDAAAVQTYKKYMANKKMMSLDQKALNGDFSSKTKEAYNHIVRNKMKLERFVGVPVAK